MGLASVIEGHARQTPDKVALHFAGHDVSYQALWQRIEAATATLIRQGTQPGDRVAWLGFNDPAMPVLLFTLARIGAILLPLNYRLAPLELKAILAHADVALLVADSTCRVIADELAAQANIKVFDAAHVASDARSAAPGLDVGPLKGNAASPVLLVYSSGTTGQPKGALHTQAGMLANCAASSDMHQFSRDDHVLTVLPMFHVGGLCIQTLPALVAGARVTLHARFDAGQWLGDVQRLRPTTSLLVPATLRAVLDHPAFAATDLSSLRLLGAGSSTIPASQIQAFHSRGVPVCQVYGATETGPVSVYLRRDEAVDHAGSAGRAGLKVEVRLVDAQGATVPQGEVGEIWLRAPNVMSHYWRDLDNPAFQHGWFHSGDLARCDVDGFYWVVGRSKDMIISGGENIYPAEIENILVDCPLIQEAAVVGMPDEKWGEVALAVIVKKPAAVLDAGTVMKLFDGKLARFKHPRQIVFLEALPKTALGKVQKAELRGKIGG
jgi:fatty-acyl-CoA synthase